MDNFWASPCISMQRRWLATGSGADMRIQNETPELITVHAAKGWERCYISSTYPIKPNNNFSHSFFPNRNIVEVIIFFLLPYLMLLSKCPLTEEFPAPLSLFLTAHLLLFPPMCLTVSARWDMLFGLIYNVSPAPGHHVWQMTYFCADPHRALTRGVERCKLA